MEHAEIHAKEAHGVIYTDIKMEMEYAKALEKIAAAIKTVSIDVPLKKK